MKFDYDVVLSGSGPFSAGNCRNDLTVLFAVLPFVPFVSQLFPGSVNRAELSARCPCGSCPGLSTLSPKRWFALRAGSGRGDGRAARAPAGGETGVARFFKYVTIHSR